MSFDSAFQSLFQVIKNNTAATVTYSRGATNYENVKATRAKSIHQSDTREGGTSFRFATRDYLIDVADLPISPEIGDLITDTTNGFTNGYEVQRPDGEDDAWRFSDTAETRYRIHTKRISRTEI